MVGGEPVLLSLGREGRVWLRSAHRQGALADRGTHQPLGQHRAPAVGHGLAFYPTGFSSPHLLAIRMDGRGDVTQSHIAWRVTRGVPQKPSIVLVGDLIFMVNDVGIASAVEAKTGEVVWNARVGGTFSASPVSDGSRVYFFSEDGKTTVIEAGRQFKLLAENQLDDGFMASPAISGRVLFLRTRTHLYRIE